MNNTQTVAFQLSPEDSASLAAEAERRQIEPTALAHILLQDSLNKINLPPSPIAQNQIECLEKLYSFRDQTEVLQFLEQYPFLLPVLLEAPDKIRHYFPDSHLFLEVVTDPEGIDEAMLELAICMNLDPDEAVDRLNHFQDNWWLDLSNQVRKPLCPILEYPHDF